MGLPTLNKFCCCCSLEAGGLIIGWINTIISFFGILGAIGMIFFGSTVVLVGQEVDALVTGIWLIAVGCVYGIFFLIYFLAGFLLISAVRHRDHERMRLIMILMAISVFLSFISIGTSLYGGLAGALIYSAFTCYFFICIYSLYVKLKEDGKGGAIHLQPTPYA